MFVCLCARGAAGGWGRAEFTCACQELESSIIHAMSCGEFFAMMEEPKLHERLKGVTVRFVTRYTEDQAASLEMSTPVANAMSTVFKAMACLLVLLEPTPGFLGTSASAVAKIVAHESSNPEDFLSSLRLHLADQGIWQARVDEVLKLGGRCLEVRRGVEGACG